MEVAIHVVAGDMEDVVDAEDGEVSVDSEVAEGVEDVVFAEPTDIEET
jgi:hypothetical protein